MTCRWCGCETNELIESCADCRAAWRDRRRWAFERAQERHGHFGPRTDEQINATIRNIERQISVVEWREGKRPEGYDGT